MSEYSFLFAVMLVILSVACVSALSLPVIYALSKVWRRSGMGWLVMANYTAYAYSLILTLAYGLGLKTPLVVMFLVEALGFFAIAITSILLARKIWIFNFSKKYKQKNEKQ